MFGILRNKAERLWARAKRVPKWVYITLVVFLVLFTFGNIISAPMNFKPLTRITIEEGVSIKEAANVLKENHIIKSRNVFSILVQLSKEKTVASGEYIFEGPQNVFEIAYRLINADYGIPVRNVVLTEGMTVAEMAERLYQTYDNFDKAYFLELAKPLEGYLFPDTYKFSTNVKTEEVLDKLIETFEEKLDLIAWDLAESKYSLEEIIIMASIIEKEATRDTIQEVSNILWKRYEIGMPLQVDATFVYSIGKGTFDLTMDDLVSDDPYNTYVNPGLPPSPISNPGLDTIRVSAKPEETDNLFFLTGHDGNMYFAETFEEHERNKSLYLP